MSGTAVESEYGDGGLPEKLKIFSSGLGNIFQDLIGDVGQEMAEEAGRTGAFSDRTGRLRRSIRFLYKGNTGALTTRKTLAKSNAWYANPLEHGADIQAKKSGHLVFKINGEWKKVKKVRTRPRPFMNPVFDGYWKGDGAKGYTVLAAALNKKMEEELK